MSNNKKVIVENRHSMPLNIILGVIFIVLKLIGLIEWSWVWVLAPFWIGAIMIILSLILYLIANLF